jgi:hypothetical protein
MVIHVVFDELIGYPFVDVATSVFDVSSITCRPADDRSGVVAAPMHTKERPA